MNLREAFKKLRSPFGKTLLTLIGIVVLVLILLPMLLRDEAGGLGGSPIAVEKDSFEIFGSTRPIIQQGVKYNKENPGVVEPEPAAPDLPPPPDPERKLPRPPQPPDETTGPVKSSSTTPTAPVDKTSRRDPGMDANLPTLITLIDGENNTRERDAFISERYAPYGRLISCKMVNTVESGNVETPLIAVVIEDLWWINQYGEKKLIIPAGTEVHGTIQGAKPLRNRLTTGNDFVLVWQATTEMVGFELQLQGMALEKSTQPGDKGLATISDMSAGIPGQVVSNENLAKALMYTLAFGQGLAQGYQTTEAYAQEGNTIVTQEGTAKNAVARGAESLTQMMLQDVGDMVAKESFYIRVAAGTEFYLFVKQVINLDDAHVANTLLNQLETEKINGKAMAGQQNHKQVLNAFPQR